MPEKSSTPVLCLDEADVFSDSDLLESVEVPQAEKIMEKSRVFIHFEACMLRVSFGECKKSESGGVSHPFFPIHYCSLVDSKGLSSKIAKP